MKFLFPQFLWALGVLAIPVIIHLFNFRRFQQVIFPNVRFLQAVQIQNQSKQQLRKILVLIARCLMLAFLVLAFARPFIPTSDSTRVFSGQVLSVYIDNSFSMNAVSPEGQLLESAKNKARELAKSYGSSDRFQLLTNDFEGRHQRLVTREQFLQWVDEIELSPQSRSMSEIYQRQMEVLEKERSETVSTSAFQISDFQETMADATEMKGDSLTKLYIIPLEPNAYNNVSIDSVWMSTPYIRPGQTISMQVRLSNNGTEDIEEENITLTINGEQKGLAAFDLPAGAVIEKEISFTIDNTGWHQGSVKINDEPITFDDELFFAFEAKQHLPVLVVNNGESNKYLKGLFATDQYFQYSEQNVQQLDFASIKSHRLIVLDQVASVSSGLADELEKFLASGGTLYIIPPAGDEVPAGLNSFLTQWGLPALSAPQQLSLKADRINKDHPLFRSALKKWESNMEYPSVTRYYSFQPSPAAFEKLISLQNGEDLLRVYRKGSGSIYLQNVPLNTAWTSLPTNFIFPSALLNMSFNSARLGRLFFVLGEDQVVPLGVEQKSAENLFEVKKASFSMVPEVINRDNELMLNIGSELKEAGNYEVFAKEDATRGVLARLGFNFNRKESATGLKSGEKIASEIPPGMSVHVMEANPKSVGKIVKEQDMGRQFWKWCVVLALLFVTIEILLLRFLK